MDIIKFIQFPAAVDRVSKLDGYGSINYKVALADETNYLVKIYDAGQKKFVQEIERIISVLEKCCSAIAGTRYFTAG